MFIPVGALRIGAEQLGVSLEDGQVEKLDGYVQRLIAWNQKINLTTVTEPNAIVDKHLLDCLALVPLVPERGTVIDIGTGPGLPSVVLAIVRPELEITAVESIQKKAMFVRTVARELNLKLRVEPVRLESIAAGREFDLAVSRATFDPPEWVERGSVLVRPGGQLFTMLSEQQPEQRAPDGWTALPLVSNSIGGAVRRVARYQRGS